MPARSRTGVEELPATVARLRCHVCRPSADPSSGDRYGVYLAWMGQVAKRFAVSPELLEYSLLQSQLRCPPPPPARC